MILRLKQRREIRLNFFDFSGNIIPFDMIRQYTNETNIDSYLWKIGIRLYWYSLCRDNMVVSKYFPDDIDKSILNHNLCIRSLYGKYFLPSICLNFDVLICEEPRTFKRRSVILYFNTKNEVVK